MLFSSLSISELADPALRPKRRSLDRHHLFPKAYLKKCGVTKRRAINQIANLTLVEWPDNVKIGARSPREYVPEILKRASLDGQWTQMQRLHALPDRWWEMEYEDFLARRRELMAGLIREAFQAL